MYDRRYSAGLFIASQGTQESELVNTAYGEMRSRDGANLKFTTNDAKGIFQEWSEDFSLPPEAYIYLENPTIAEIKEAFNKINIVLSEYPQEQTGIDLYFAGHGEYPSGSLVIKDHVLTAKELIYLMSVPLNPSQGKRGLSFILDSCYAGSFLINIVLELEHNGCRIKLFDAKVSSMHDEKAWELEFLEHGAFTFTFLNPGNGYVNNIEFTRAIEKQDHRLLAKYLQGSVGHLASSTAFLTQGRQHSIDCLKGDHITIDGHGYFSISDIEGIITRENLIKEFEKAKNVIWEEGGSY